MEQGSCLIDGQHVPIVRPRVPQCGDKELPPGTYQLFQRVSPADETPGPPVGATPQPGFGSPGQ